MRLRTILCGHVFSPISNILGHGLQFTRSATSILNVLIKGESQIDFFTKDVKLISFGWNDF